MPTAKVTTSLSVIKKWTEERGGTPAVVETYDHKGSGLLKISIEGRHESALLKKLPWDEWYDIFRQYRLQFMYEDREDDGELSFKYKITQRKV